DFRRPLDLDPSPTRRSSDLWRPAARGLHVHQLPDGRWQAGWPDHEGYDLGPSSIAWLTWHMVFWWSMVLDHSFGEARLSREDVVWPGSADGSSDDAPASRRSSEPTPCAQHRGRRDCATRGTPYAAREFSKALGFSS